MSYPIRPADLPAWHRAIQFIALNDDPADLNYRNVLGYMTVILTAETFRVHVAKVARAVVRARRQYIKSHF